MVCSVVSQILVPGSLSFTCFQYADPYGQYLPQNSVYQSVNSSRCLLSMRLQELPNNLITCVGSPCHFPDPSDATEAGADKTFRCVQLTPLVLCTFLVCLQPV